MTQISLFAGIELFVRRLPVFNPQTCRFVRGPYVVGYKRLDGLLM